MFHLVSLLIVAKKRGSFRVLFLFSFGGFRLVVGRFCLAVLSGVCFRVRSGIGLLWVASSRLFHNVALLLVPHSVSKRENAEAGCISLLWEWRPKGF